MRIGTDFLIENLVLLEVPEDIEEDFLTAALHTVTGYEDKASIFLYVLMNISLTTCPSVTIGTSVSSYIRRWRLSQEKSNTERRIVYRDRLC